MGAVLPLAGPALYHSLGANWAGTFLGLLEAACIPIPFVFYRYGRKIREKSALIRAMEEERRRDERRERRREGRAAAAVVAAAEAEAEVGAEGQEKEGAKVVLETKGGMAEGRMFLDSNSPSLEESEERRDDSQRRDLEKGEV
jgi:hypothetical protein